MRFDRKVALVTGGAAGIGRAIAQRLASEGACVVITDVQREPGQATAQADGFTFLEQEVTNEEQWTEVVADIEERYERLNILVNNAGILGLPGTNPETASLVDWRRIFAVNVEGVFLGCRTTIPAMRRAGGGSIVNVASMGDRIATPEAMAYGASKAAVRQLTTSVAQHCAQEKLNVRCNSVHPGVVRTSLWDSHTEAIAQQRGIPFDRLVSQASSAIPLGDFTRAEDVAAAVAFLASDDALHITGSALLVDGGFVHCNTYRGGTN